MGEFAKIFFVTVLMFSWSFPVLFCSLYPLVSCVTFHFLSLSVSPLVIQLTCDPPLPPHLLCIRPVPCVFFPAYQLLPCSFVSSIHCPHLCFSASLHLHSIPSLDYFVSSRSHYFSMLFCLICILVLFWFLLCFFGLFLVLHFFFFFFFCCSQITSLFCWQPFCLPFGWDRWISHFGLGYF